MFETLTVLFVVLKLIGAIDWSWLWVLSPAWIGVLFYALMAQVWEQLR